jgi:hypothetical protein
MLSKEEYEVLQTAAETTGKFPLGEGFPFGEPSQWSEAVKKMVDFGFLRSPYLYDNEPYSTSRVGVTPNGALAMMLYEVMQAVIEGRDPTLMAVKAMAKDLKSGLSITVDEDGFYVTSDG